MLFLLGGLIQINPIWQWGPYHPYLSENGAQPDWYIGWLIGALRLMPNLRAARSAATRSSRTRSGAARCSRWSCSPCCSRGRRSSAGSPRDHRRHDLLDRPRDRPIRTAVGAAFLTWVVIIFAVGSTDRLFYRLDISYTAQIHFWRVGVWLLPIVVFFATRSACRALQRSEAHPLSAWDGEIVRRGRGGAIEILGDGTDRSEAPVPEPSVGTSPSEQRRSGP